MIQRLLPRELWAREFLIRWVLIAVGVTGVQLIASWLASATGVSRQLSWVPLILGLLLVAIGDWIVLRRHIPGAAAWIAATALGGCAGIGLGAILLIAVAVALWQLGVGLESFRDPRVAFLFVLPFVVAWEVVVLYAQARVLRRATRQPGTWIRVNAGLLLISLLVALVWVLVSDVPAAPGEESIGTRITNAVYALVSSSAYALVTGLALVRMLKDPPDPPLPRLFPKPNVVRRSTLPEDPMFQATARAARPALLVGCGFLGLLLVLVLLVTSRASR